jgi:hypothetical protein
MLSKATSVDQYMEELPDDRIEAMSQLRSIIIKNIPKGFEEYFNYGMVCFVVPHKLYPAGYHCKPSDPLPFISIASQKNFIAFYHMGIYSDKSLHDWFVDEYNKLDLPKLDMGKSCIRFKKVDKIPLKLIGELVKKMTVKDWIGIYEMEHLKSKK